MTRKPLPRQVFVILALTALSISTAALARASAISGSTNNNNASFVYLSTNNIKPSATARPRAVSAGEVVSIGATGISPWETMSGIGSGSTWISPGSANSLSSASACRFCAAHISAVISPLPETSTLIIFGTALSVLAVALRRKSTR